MKKLLTVILVVVLTFSVLILSGCKSQKVEVPENNGENINWNYDETTNVLTISGMGAMPDYDSLNPQPWGDTCAKTVVIEEGITRIGANAFSNCRDIVNVTIPNTVTEIGESAFACCNIEVLEIPYSVTKIDLPADEFIYIDCYKVDENNKYYSSDEFGALFNKDKTELLFCPKKLTSYQIPESVTEIGYCAFHNSNLTSITIPDGVTNIGDFAFFSCVQLMDIEIPVSVTTIGDAAFSTYGEGDFDGYRDIYYLGTKEDWERINMRSEFPDTNILFECN